MAGTVLGTGVEGSMMTKAWGPAEVDGSQTCTWGPVILAKETRLYSDSLGS